MTLDELLALLPDNTAGEIGADDMRTITTELYNKGALFATGTVAGPLALGAAAAWTPLGTPRDFTLAADHPCLLILSAYLDTAVNNNAVELALALTGATVVPPQDHQRLRAGAKQTVDVTLSISYVQALAAGTTTIAAQYKAAVGGGSVENLTLTAVALG
jgi:hypothetical protein